MALDGLAQSAVPGDELGRLNGVHKADGSGQALFQELQNQGGDPDLQCGSVLAHVSVAADHVQAAIETGRRVRLIPRVDDRAVVERVDACIYRQKVRSLRDLVQVVRRGRVIPFDTALSSACVDLARRKKREKTLDQYVRRDAAGHQIAFVSAVAGAMKVGIVLVERHGESALFGAPPGCFKYDALAGFVVRYEIANAPALRRRIFGVTVVVVESGAIRQHTVASLFFPAHQRRARRID